VAKKPQKSKIPKFSAVVTPLAEELHDAAVATLSVFAYAERDRFVEEIERQDFPAFRHVPLAASTLARKAAAGRDLRTMIATGNYIDSIRVFRRTVVNGVEWRIGFHPRKRARDLDGRIVDILLEEVAKIQEHGSLSAGVPARPHWSVHQRRMAVRSRALRPEILAAAMRAARHRLKTKKVK